MHDLIAEPARATLIPGFYEIKEAAMNAGSIGCSISGSGPQYLRLVCHLKMLKKLGRQ